MTTTKTGQPRHERPTGNALDNDAQEAPKPARTGRTSSVAVEYEPSRLSEHLKQKTAAIHRRAERRPFVRALGQRTLPIGVYGRYVASLSLVYEAMEAAWSTPELSRRLHGFEWSVLRRADRYRHDALILGVDPQCGVCASARQYAEHLRYLVRQRSVSLLGHAYSRYLGDMAGGQWIAKQAAMMGVPPTALSAHEFDGQNATLIASFRTALDELRLEDRERRLIVAESENSFEQTITIFDDLTEAYPQ